MRSRLFACALGAVLAFASGAVNAQTQTAGLATSSPGTLYHTWGSAIAPILADKAKVELRVQTFASPNVYLPVVNGGQVEFGFANIFEILIAYQGKEFFEGKPNPNVRLVSVTAPLRVAFFVRKDSPIKSFSDFKGKRVVWGFAQQQVINNLIVTHFEAVGLKESDIVPVPVPAVARGADDFAAGNADVFFFALGSAKVTEVDAKVGGIRAIPLPDTPQTQASFKKNYPPAYVTEAKPAPGLAGIVEPTPLMAYDGAMLTHAKAPEDLVYNVTKAMFDNAEAVSKSSPALRAFSTQSMAKKYDPIQYHPGAIKLYTEKGVWPPK